MIDEPDGRLTSSLMFPAPATAPVAPPARTAVQVIPESSAGKLSVTVVFGASDGPPLDTTRV